ncbi:hypothetical protein [Mucilaginibacter lacusdianchii]|uniref:hypothetical protein n=1 Tax=Mucilaginibacter lacusdianchii TaxID=2684211 RepID=UPI00131EB2AA|nr:hypothetical protein [Mucilaginibacter sp. JXJ CY 39]
MSSVQQDNSIIDVTGQSVIINYNQHSSILKQYAKGVPAWPHKYIYSVTDLSYTSSKQVAFHQTFKQNFVRASVLR